jgi:hypothetical protein
MNALDILRYTKNWKGKLERANGEIIEEYYFGDECEWRYALKTKHFHQFMFMEQTFKHEGMIDTIQGLIEDQRLLFTANDVRYIIIEKEEERADMESHIRSL